MNWKRMIGVALVTLLVSIHVSAMAPSEAFSQEVKKLKVGTLFIAGGVGIYAANKLGYFREEGLDVEIKNLGGGAEVVPLVISGQLDFGMGNHVSLILALAQGYDLVMVSGINAERSGPPYTEYLWVLKESPIQSLKDFEGKKIGVNNLQSIIWLYTNAYLDQSGVDTKKIRWMEIPFPQMGDTLLNKYVDGIVSVEPFGTILADTQKVRHFGNPYSYVVKGVPYSVYFGARKWIDAHPVETEKFSRAVTKASQFLRQNEAEQRKLILEFTKGKPELVNRIVLEDLYTFVNVTAMEKSEDLMTQYGMLKKPVNLRNSVWKGAEVK